MKRSVLIPLLVVAALAGVSGLSLLRFPALVTGQSPGMEERTRQLESRSTAFESRQADLDTRQAELDKRIAAFESRLATAEKDAARRSDVPVQAATPAAVAAPAPAAAPAGPVMLASGSRCTSTNSPTYTSQHRNGTNMTTTENFKGVEGLMKVEVTTSEGDIITSYSIPAWLMAAYGDNQEAIMRDLGTDLLKDRGPLRCSP